MKLSAISQKIFTAIVATGLSACATTEVGQPREVFNANDCTLSRVTEYTTGEKVDTKVDYLGINGECVRTQNVVNITVAAIEALTKASQPEDVNKFAAYLLNRLKTATPENRAVIEGEMKKRDLDPASLSGMVKKANSTGCGLNPKTLIGECQDTPGPQ